MHDEYLVTFSMINLTIFAFEHVASDWLQEEQVHADGPLDPLRCHLVQIFY